MADGFPKFCVGVVCYKPNKDNLFSLIDFFIRNEVLVVLYLNSKLNYLQAIKELGVKVIGRGENEGIAKAHIELVNHAKVNGFTHIILSDQDTSYPDDYISSMSMFITEYNPEVVCPGWVNLNDKTCKPELQYVMEDNKMELKSASHGKRLSHAISSGMVINISHDNIAKYIEDALFIDWVDNDFCWSLTSHGFNVLYNENINLHHRLGDKRKSLWGVSFTVRNDIRDYYIIRNALFLLLYKRYNIVGVKKYLFFKFIQHVALSLVMAENKLNNCKMVYFAIKHALIKKLGSWK